MLVNNMRALAALLWLLLLVIASGLVFTAPGSQPLLRTSVIEFLPQPDYPPSVTPLIQEYDRRNQRQLVYLLVAATAQPLLTAAAELEQRLLENGLWQRNGESVAMDMRSSWTWWQTYASGLLSASDQDLLAQAQYERVAENFIARLFSPAVPSAGFSSQDPFMLLQNFLLFKDDGAIRKVHIGGYDLIQRQDQFGLLLRFRTERDVYQLESNQALADAIAEINFVLGQNFPDVAIVTTGALLHINSGITHARNDVVLVGGGSILAILLLFVFAFRSVAPFFFSLIVLGTGLLAGFVFTRWLMGPVHILAFVFCSSVIGLGVDYCLHYFVQRNQSDSAVVACRQILVPTGLGMASSLLAFLVLALLPFPGFRQMAVMTALSLLAAWISLILWLPMLERKRTGFTKQRSDTAALLRLADKLLSWVGRLWLFPRLLTAGLIIVVFGCATVAWRLEPVDDLRQLQVPERDLLQAEQLIARWLERQPDSAYFLVAGQSEQDVLARAERLCERLRDGRYMDAVSATCLTDWLPSQATQLRNHELKIGLMRAGHLVSEPLLAVGVKPELVQESIEALGKSGPLLLPSEFFKGPLAAHYQLFWLSSVPNVSVSGLVIPLAAVHDRAALAALAEQMDGVYWVDAVSTINRTLQHFRSNALIYLILSYAAILLFLSVRYGVRRSYVLYLPVLGGALMVCAVSALGLISFNLFAAMALILVAGMGVDYGIFFMEASSDRRGVLAAVLVSAITTLIAFGLLALSSTAAIQSFGQAILVGMATVLFCILLIQAKEKY